MNAKFMKTSDCFTFGSRSTAMGNKEHGTTFVMLELCDRFQGSIHNDKGATRLVKFRNKTEGYKVTADLFPRFQNLSYPKIHNEILDSLVKIVISFYSKFYHTGCFILVSLLRSPKV